MPRLGSEVVDEAFVAKLRAWITALPPPIATSGELQRLSNLFCVRCHGSAMGVESWWADRRGDAIARIQQNSMPRPGPEADAITPADRAALVEAIQAVP